LGGIFDRRVTRNPLKNKIFRVILCLLIGYFSMKNMVFLTRLSNDISNDEYYEKMRYNRNYHDYYMDWLMDQPHSKYAERIENILPSCENYCLLAEYFLAKKNYEQAENSLRIAANMIPTRIRPQYLLWQLYIETENKSAALETAQKILLTPVKVESVFSLQVKAQMKKYCRDKTMPSGI
jgi:tetratricopeptide (TPR) repeat protein